MIGHLKTPLGTIKLTIGQHGLRSLKFINQAPATISNHDDLAPYISQLTAYFADPHTSFSNLALALQGTDFQLKVWQYLLTIAPGQTVTYGEVAAAIGHPGAVRAVGTAVGRNCLPIIIPCHRVVPRSGGIGQFSCGVWRKRWLLEHEEAKKYSNE